MFLLRLGRFHEAVRKILNFRLLSWPFYFIRLGLEAFSVRDTSHGLSNAVRTYSCVNKARERCQMLCLFST